MTSRPRWSGGRFSSALVLLSTVVVVVALNAGCALARSPKTGGGDGAPLKRPMTKRRVARLPGDILIGALFPVHRQPSLKTAYTRQCGEVTGTLL